MPQWLNTSAQCANQQQRIVKILESVRPVSEQVTTTIQKLLAATVAKSARKTKQRTVDAVHFVGKRKTSASAMTKLKQIKSLGTLQTSPIFYSRARLSFLAMFLR